MSTFTIRSFAGGEISPSLHARVDTAKYASGLRTCRNATVMKNGGTINRAGTQFVGQVFENRHDVPMRLIPFTASNGQSYIIEMCRGASSVVLRFIKNGEYIYEAPTTITAVEFGVDSGDDTVLTKSGPGAVVEGIVRVSGFSDPRLNGCFKTPYDPDTTKRTLNFFNDDKVNFSDVDQTITGNEQFEDRYQVHSVQLGITATELVDLQYVQNGDVMYFTHPNNPITQLTWAGDTSWTYELWAPGASIDKPVLTNTNAGASGGGIVYVYSVSAVAASGEETLPRMATLTNRTSAATNPHSYTWAAITGAVYYNVYVTKDGVSGFWKSTVNLGFTYSDEATNSSISYPQELTSFLLTENYPAACSIIQQRLVFASTNSEPESVWLSAPGSFGNFTVRAPVQDDDAVKFTIAGRRVSPVRHLVDMGKLVVLSDSNEKVVRGNEAGVITPSGVNPDAIGQSGCAKLRPLFLNDSLLFLQARRSIIRDMGFEFTADGYKGNDLTIFANHLFRNKQVVDWEYAQNPDSIVWAARSDGTLLGLTYVKEQQIIAWHRHDFATTSTATANAALVKNVCVVPEGDEDVVYAVVARFVANKDGENPLGIQQKYLERLTLREFSDIVDARFLDCSASYDGRNTDSTHTMILSGSGWTSGDELTLTSNVSFFAATDVGNEIQLRYLDSVTGAQNELIRFRISGFTSGTVVTGTPHKDVLPAYQSVTTSDWARAVDQLSGLQHLENCRVSVLADGFVVANPNNPSYEAIEVEDGQITLDKPYSVIHVGLPYISDVETLDIDSAEGSTLADKKKQVSKVTLHVEDSRGIWVGNHPGDDSLTGLTEVKVRNDESYDDPVALQTGVIDVNISAEWNSNGRVLVRQVDPLPMSILAITPAGLLPFGRSS
jgi:hypothetical protein